MKLSVFRIAGAAVTVLGLIFSVAVAPVFCEDYLVIKRKDGTTQKIPLKFDADEIEAFDVETGPESGAPPSLQRPAEVEGQPAEPPGRPPGVVEEPGREAKPLDITPPARRPGLLPQPQPGRERAPEARRPAPGPVSQPRLTVGPGTFTVNLYKLPDHVKAIPDYSAIRPRDVITSDKIDIAPPGNEMPGLPADTKGLGMRFTGLFTVTGEGIFQWRLRAKDGVRMHIDDKTLIENDGIQAPATKTGYIHLAQGLHVILVDSFNSQGSPVLQLSVTPPVGQEEVFSIAKGLQGWKEPQKPYDVLWGQVYFVPKGSYPKGPDFSQISPIGRLIASELDLSAKTGFPGLPGRDDMIGIRYEGYFQTKGAGIFAFRLVSDDYAKLKIGKHEITEVAGKSEGSSEGTLGWAFLQDGSYPISLDYFHDKGDPRLALYVTQPMKEEELFSPARTLQGFASDGKNVNMIPAFVYFLEPKTRKLPNFNKMSPSGMFFTDAIDYPVDRGTSEFPGVPKRAEWLGVRFYVKFSLSEQEAGTYKFRVVANDGARLILGKKLVVNADGYGKTQEASGSVTLKAGSHEMFLDYFQGKGTSGVQLFITPPDGEEKIFAFQ